jgi:O-antigen/teichoic acid export membrane protein
VNRTAEGPLARSAAWLFAGKGTSILCQSITFILVGRLLGSAEYGLYVGVYAFVAFLGQWSTAGSQFVLLRHVSQRPSEVAPYWGNILLLTFSLGGGLAVVGLSAGPHIVHSGSRFMFSCMALSECVLGPLTVAAGSVFQAFDEMRFTALLNLLNNGLRLLLASTLFLFRRHVYAQTWVSGIVWIYLVAAVTALLLVTRRFGRPVLSWRRTRASVGEGIVFAASSSTTNVYNDIDKMLLGHFGMNAANGIYTLAYRLIDMSMMPISSLHAAAFPRFCRIGVGGVGRSTEYAAKLIKRTAPAALAFAAIMWISAPLLPHIVGHSFAASTGALRWLCFIPLFRSFQYSAGDAMTGAGFQPVRLGIQLVAASFNFFVNLYLIPRYGWLGAAWSSLITDGALGVANWIALFTLRILPYPSKRQEVTLTTAVTTTPGPSSCRG